MSEVSPKSDSTNCLDSTLEVPVCDACGTGVSPEHNHILSPPELRIIAGNGYGRHLKLWGDIAPSERESKFYQLSITNDTDLGSLSFLLSENARVCG